MILCLKKRFDSVVKVVVRFISKKKILELYLIYSVKCFLLVNKYDKSWFIVLNDIVKGNNVI